MSNYSLRRSVQSCAIDGKCSRLNRVTDSLLRSIFGDFEWKSPRNWFGGTREGEWTNVIPKTDKLHSLIAQGCVIILLTLLVNSLISQDWALFSVAIINIIFIISAATIIIPNTSSPNAIFEYMSFGKSIKPHLKSATLITLIWLALYLGVGHLYFGSTQQAIISMKQQIVPATALLLVMQVLVIPWAESTWFAVCTIPSMSRIVGFIPALITTTVWVGVIHSAVFNMAAFPIMMSMIRVMMTFTRGAQQQEAYPELISHIEANLLAVVILPMMFA